MVSNPSVNWRSNHDLATGAIQPLIYDKAALKSVLDRYRYRHVVTTCDFKLLVKYFDRLLAYQNSNSQIPFLVGVYSSKVQQKQILKNLNHFKEKYKLNKIIFFQFYCEKLDIINSLQSDEISFDYKINYVRNSRYLLVSQIWKLANIDKEDYAIDKASTYVVDFDNEFLADNSIIKKEFSQKNLVFSWNSAQCQHNPDFPSTLTGLTLKNNGRVITNHPYKIIKAGFTILSPCSLTHTFLFLYNNYCIGDPQSMVSIRLFTFYFSDQLAMLLSLHDIKSADPLQYKHNISWIDINTSPLVNLDKFKQYMWYPKGNNFKQKANNMPN